MKSTVIEIKNSQEEVIEMREERASEFEDRLLEILHSEEHRETDWSKINTGSEITRIGIFEGEESERSRKNL